MVYCIENIRLSGPWKQPRLFHWTIISYTCICINVKCKYVILLSLTLMFTIHEMSIRKLKKNDTFPNSGKFWFDFLDIIRESNFLKKKKEFYWSNICDEKMIQKQKSKMLHIIKENMKISLLKRSNSKCCHLAAEIFWSTQFYGLAFSPL